MQEKKAHSVAVGRSQATTNARAKLPWPKGVIFDLFHTLTARESASPFPFTSDVLGIDRGLWDELLMERSRWRLAGEERDPYVIIRTLARQADPAIPDERIREAVRVRSARFRHTLAGVPRENVETLERLRAAGLRLGLVSNADVMEVAGWPESPLSGCFDAEVFSCMSGCVKPEREIFQRCLDALELAAADCVFVGDGGSDELTAARALGMHTVFVSGVMAELWPDRVEARLGACDRHIHTIPELLQVLPGLR
jgi:putative hydrolase of the HAD superfamily